MHYADEMTVQEGLKRYFEANGFGVDGGYEKQTVAIPVGPFVLNLPNTAARKRAVQRHDIHHLVTGYATDLLGEAEIAAWELASGCRDYYAAWILNVMALFAGIFIHPGRLWQAFWLGRQCSNLYHEAEVSPFLQLSIGELRKRLQITGSRGI